MRNKVIFFTIYNRPDYLKESLRGWREVYGLENYDIYFRIEPSDVIDSVVSEIVEFSKDTKANVDIILNREKQGCARNTWNGFEELLKRYNFAILTEDDIMPAKDVVKYFDVLTDKYYEDKSVLSISANYEVSGYAHNKITRVPSFRGQIWGTWKDRWDQYIRDTWDFDYSTAVDNGPAGWDCNLTLRVIPKNNLVTIGPHSSRSQHIGVDGLHCNKDVFPSTLLESFEIDHTWEELVEE